MIMAILGDDIVDERFGNQEQVLLGGKQSEHRAYLTSYPWPSPENFRIFEISRQ